MPFSNPDVRSAALELISVRWDQQVVLDVGVGNGFYGEALHQRFNATVYGIEVWPSYIVNQLLHYRTIFLCDARIFEYEMLANKVDLVILGDVVEHFEKSEAVSLIQRLKNLFPWLIMTIPIVDVLQGAYGGNVYETHRHQWKISEIEQDLGFKLIKDCGMCGLFEYGAVARERIRTTPAIVISDKK